MKMLQKRGKKQVNNISVNNNETEKFENTEIVYVCKSTNNKNVRANELVILEKHPEELYFIFGENNVNAKKRYYNDLETLNEDFEALQKIKNSKNKRTSIETKNRKREIFDENEDI